MRKSKRDQVTMLQLYPVFIKLFLVSLVFPLISVALMFSIKEVDQKYIPVFDLPAEVQTRIDFKESLFRAKDGTVVDVDLIKYKEITQISAESVTKIYKVLGKQTYRNRVNNGILSFFFISMSYSIINGLIVAILQNRRERLNDSEFNVLSRSR